MSEIVLRIGSRVDGVPTPVDGQFIVRYDPSFDRTGAYLLDTSADIDAGHVNRPITCYHIELLPRTR